MSDNNLKIFAYSNDKFDEVDAIYYSKDSNNITFTHKDQIFKLDYMTNKKRKREQFDDQITLEQEHKKVFKENIQLKEQITKIMKVSNDIVAKSKKIIKEKDECMKNLYKTKMELLRARVQLEKSNLQQK
jgi:hypothetical protein